MVYFLFLGAWSRWERSFPGENSTAIGWLQNLGSQWNTYPFLWTFCCV